MIAETVSVTSPLGIVVFIIMLFFYVGFAVLVVSLLIRLYMYLKTAGKEQKLIRMEIGKLAEEVHQMRQESKGGRKQDSSEK